MEIHFSFLSIYLISNRVYVYLTWEGICIQVMQRSEVRYPLELGLHSVLSGQDLSDTMRTPVPWKHNTLQSRNPFFLFFPGTDNQLISVQFLSQPVDTTQIMFCRMKMQEVFMQEKEVQKRTGPYHRIFQHSQQRCLAEWETACS